MNKINDDKLRERVALEELNAAFNQIAEGCSLDATSAACVSITFTAALLARQFAPGENKKVFRRNCVQAFADNLQLHLPMFELS